MIAGEVARCRISVNPERRSAIWWDLARVSLAAPTAIRPLLEIFGPTELVTTIAEASAIRAWGGTIADWDDGPPPLLIETLPYLPPSA